LPPGEYLLTFYYLDATIERKGIKLAAGKTITIAQAITPTNRGEVIAIKSVSPTIDPSSTTQGVTIDKNYIKNVPVPGRTFESALGAAAGAQKDKYGVSFSGSSSLENQYIVNGINTTGVTTAVAPRKDNSGTEAYDRVDENPFLTVGSQPLSTFSS